MRPADCVRSIRLLTDACQGFTQYAITGLKANKTKIQHFVATSLMLVTALTPKIGYDKAAEVVKKAIKDDILIKDCSEKLGFEGKEYIRVTVRDEHDNDFFINFKFIFCSF